MGSGDEFLHGESGEYNDGSPLAAYNSLVGASTRMFEEFKRSQKDILYLKDKGDRLAGRLDRCNDEITKLTEEVEELLCLYRQEAQKPWYQKIFERWWRPATPKTKPSQPLSTTRINPDEMLPPRKRYPVEKFLPSDE